MLNKYDFLLDGYENRKLVHYSDMGKNYPKTVPYDELQNQYIDGVLIASRYIDGRLMQTFSKTDSHILTVAATRMGKTTSCVIPQVLSFAKQKVKRSMLISDPKGELYRILSETLKENGYKVLLINFKDFSHSECWNPLLSIYTAYQKAVNIEKDVALIKTEKGYRNMFMNVIYENQSELDIALDKIKKMIIADVDTAISNLFGNIIAEAHKEPYWTDAARQWGKALLWSMLEDSVSYDDCINPAITKDTFSFNTLFTIMGSLSPQKQYDNKKYFSKRRSDSFALKYAKVIIENSEVTSRCIISTFTTAIAAYTNSAMRLLTSCNSFDVSQFVSSEPTVLFICYPDDSRVYYDVIGMFVSETYQYLIKVADAMPRGKLERPFYFILDEFANFPRFNDMDIVITACGGRNIWFDLILQSYAQLDNVYGAGIAEIIRDNMNVRIFLGSNNAVTLEKFSNECGLTTRISPSSVFFGSSNKLEKFEIETIPLIPKSVLAQLGIGEAIILEIGESVKLTRLERYFMCKEFLSLKQANLTEYSANVNVFNPKYEYELPNLNRRMG